MPPLNQTPCASFSCGGGEGSGRWRVGTGSLMAQRHRVPRAPRGPGAGEGQSPPGAQQALGSGDGSPPKQDPRRVGP